MLLTSGTAQVFDHSGPPLGAVAHPRGRQGPVDAAVHVDQAKEVKEVREIKGLEAEVGGLRGEVRSLKARTRDAEMRMEEQGAARRAAYAEHADRRGRRRRMMEADRDRGEDYEHHHHHHHHQQQQQQQQQQRDTEAASASENGAARAQQYPAEVVTGGEKGKKANEDRTRRRRIFKVMHLEQEEQEALKNEASVASGGKNRAGEGHGKEWRRETETVTRRQLSRRERRAKEKAYANEREEKSDKEVAFITEPLRKAEENGGKAEKYDKERAERPVPRDRQMIEGQVRRVLVPYYFSRTAHQAPLQRTLRALLHISLSLSLSLSLFSFCR